MKSKIMTEIKHAAYLRETELRESGMICAQATLSEIIIDITKRLCENVILIIIDLIKVTR